MIKKIALTTLIALLARASEAQIVSLNTQELRTVSALIKTNADARFCTDTLINRTDTYLKDSPNPADTILTEGILKGDPRKVKTWKQLEDMQKVYSFALAFKMTNKKKYLQAANDFILAWASRNQPQGNPINDTNLDKIIFSIDLLKADLPTKTVETANAWLLKVAEAETKRYPYIDNDTNPRTRPINNWHSHRIKIVAEVAFTIENESLKEWVRKQYVRHIGLNLNPDGSSFDFHERDALHYHVYDLEPLMVAATILARDPAFDQNPYTLQSANKSSLKRSFDWFLPYYTGKKTHQEFVHSKQKFDRDRAKNGEKGYQIGHIFNANEADGLIQKTAYFDADLLYVYQEKAKTKKEYPHIQFILNKAKQK
ncbi:alginate lyase family protein [Pedobacter sp. MW01-1-1]|uniref:alginate lyase family protein n=1 Tax=Pedobacter sp. MW01-1-1 TaxID=3383027 RepID=UPI003FF0D775